MRTFSRLSASLSPICGCYSISGNWSFSKSSSVVSSRKLVNYLKCLTLREKIDDVHIDGYFNKLPIIEGPSFLLWKMKRLQDSCHADAFDLLLGKNFSNRRTGVQAVKIQNLASEVNWFQPWYCLADDKCRRKLQSSCGEWYNWTRLLWQVQQRQQTTPQTTQKHSWRRKWKTMTTQKSNDDNEDRRACKNYDARRKKKRHRSYNSTFICEIRQHWTLN